MDDERIIVSLTTSPKRIDKIKPVIDCLMNQTTKPTLIYLNLPHVFKRDGSTFDKIPDFIENNKIIIVNRCEDIGPITKILPTIEKEKNSKNTVIISIDDDILHNDDKIETYIKYSRKYPNSVITMKAHYSSIISKNNKGIINKTYFVEGYAGVLYKTEFFDNFDYSVLDCKSCFLGDDLVISNHLIKNNIDIRSFTSNGIKELKLTIEPLGYGEEEDALHSSTFFISKNAINYYKCLNYLKDKNKLCDLYDTNIYDRLVLVKNIFLLLYNNKYIKYILIILLFIPIIILIIFLFINKCKNSCNR